MLALEVLPLDIDPPALPPSAAATLAASLRPLEEPPAPPPPEEPPWSPLFPPEPLDVAAATAPAELENPFFGMRNPIAPEDDPIAFGAPWGPSAPAYLPPPRETPTWLGAA